MVEEQLKKLGLKAIDKITGFEGVITSVCFDLYGCVQLLIHSGLDDKGEVRNPCWFDTNRVQIVNDNPIMAQPDFDFKKSIPKADKGPAMKSNFNSKPLP